MSVKTVKVNNVSILATHKEINEFFSFSGEIHFVDSHPENEKSQTVYVTFKDPQGAETAVLLSGATIVDQSVTISLAPDYTLPPVASAYAPTEDTIPASGNKNVEAVVSVVRKAEDVVSNMLAKGFTLSIDALNKAKAFDEEHNLTSTASATVTSLDQRIGLTEKINAGSTMVNEKVKEMDQKFQVSEKTKSALASAEQTVSSAGSAIMSNRYVLTGATWVTGAYNRVVAKSADAFPPKTAEQEINQHHAQTVSGSSIAADVNMPEGKNDDHSGILIPVMSSEQVLEPRPATNEAAIVDSAKPIV